jgi:hypothetical protein
LKNQIRLCKEKDRRFSQAAHHREFWHKPFQDITNILNVQPLARI